MKRILTTALLLTISAPALWSKQISFPCAGSVILLMDSSSAAVANILPDAYTRELTPFDLAIRLDKMPESLTQDDYLDEAAANVRNWPADEGAKLQVAFTELDAFVKKNGLHLHLPDTVKMIKTTGQEEFGAEGYTRGNRIMLNTAAEPISIHLVAHELWHVISRTNEQLRNDAYAVFHFKPCNSIVYKSALHGQVITNPDCPWLQHYVSVEKDGRTYDVVPVLYTKEAYHPGFSAMQNASIGLLVLSGDERHKKPLMGSDNAVVYDFGQIPDFFKKVGANTQYVLHIEEIAAEHFASLVGNRKLPEMTYVDGVKAVLQQ